MAVRMNLTMAFELIIAIIMSFHEYIIQINVYVVQNNSITCMDAGTFATRMHEAVKHQEMSFTARRLKITVTGTV